MYCRWLGEAVEMDLWGANSYSTTIVGSIGIRTPQVPLAQNLRLGYLVR